MSFWCRIIFALVLLQSVSSVVEYIPTIKSVIKLIGSPLKITVLVCWNFDIKYDFTNEFLQPYSNVTASYQFSIQSDDIENFPVVDDEHRYLIIVDVSCPKTQDLLKNVGLKLSNRFKWIVLKYPVTGKGDLNDIAIKETFKNLPVLCNSEVYYISKKEEGNYVIKQVYRISMGKNLIFELIGLHHNNTLKDFRSSRIASRRRQNLEGAMLRASLVITNNGTLNHLNDYGEKQVDTITKANYLLTNYLIRYLNATVNYTFVSSWGYMNNQTGTWSGMIGDLVENRSDIGATALFFTSNRIQYIEYIAMPTPTLSKFVFRSPKLSYTDNVFLLPFDSFVWNCIIGLFFISALALIGAVLVEWKIITSKDEISDASLLRPSFFDILLLVFGATCQQGSSVSPRTSTARIIMAITYITLMFLYTSYSANIVALLQSPSTKIKNLKDLLNSRLKFGADDTVFNRYYFSNAVEPIRRKIYEQKILQKDGSENFMPLTVGVEKIRHGLFAFHMELGVGYKIMSETFREDEKCGLQEIQYLQVIDPWYAIQKNSSYKELMKAGMMRLHEYGLQDRENSRLYTKKPKCIGGGGKFITASLVDIRAALLILLYGLILSPVLIIFEKLYKRIRASDNRN